MCRTTFSFFRVAFCGSLRLQDVTRFAYNGKQQRLANWEQNCPRLDHEYFRAAHTQCHAPGAAVAIALTSTEILCL
jgi:hypothetical protein